MSAADAAAERYHLVRRLGSGAFGTVYLARDSFLEEECAVKMPLKPHPNLAAFLQEPRLLNKVKNPSIVALRDIETIQGVLCLVMEYVSGGSLRERLGRVNDGRPFPLSFAIRITREVISALGAAHAVGVLHRDIKPDNVLLTEDGHAKVTDFGIAKIVEASGGVDYTMNPGGTMVYMSPEALHGECSAASDLWSTAVMLYEMTTGRLPFSGPSTAQFVHQIELGQSIPILDRNPALPANFASLVHRSLARAREARFPSLESFDRALGELETSTGTAFDAPAAVGKPSGSDRFPAVAPAITTEERIDRLVAEAPQRARDGAFPEVVDELRARLRERPGHPALHRALAEVYRGQGEDSWAFDEYEKAFLLDRTDRTAADGLAELGLRLRRPQRTIEALAALVEIDPSNASYQKRLAFGFAQEGRRDEAIARLKRSLELDPTQSRLSRILLRWEKGGELGSTTP